MNLTDDIRKDFPLIANSPVVYLDNAASVQKPEAVLNAMDLFYRTSYANVHRGLYTLSEQATQQYEAARDIVMKFVNAAEREEILFTSGTTASINLVAQSFVSSGLLVPGKTIVLNPGDHHSNIVPWQMAAKQTGASIVWLDVDAALRIDVSTLTEKVSNAAIVAFGHVSNSLGTIQPVQEIIAAAHANNVPVLIDAAQSASHMAIDVQAMDCDFLVFSGHKLGGPTGIGVLYGKHAWLKQLQPWQGGGDMISEVTLEGFTAAELPAKFEAGTPNIAGAIGLGAAITYLQQLGMEQIQTRCNELYTYLVDALQAHPAVIVLGVKDRTLRTTAVSFSVEGVHPHDIAEILNQSNVAIRAGHHCAQPTMQLLGVPATARASVYIYNSAEDIDRLMQAVDHVVETFTPKTL